MAGDPVAASSSATGLAPIVIGLASPIVRLENRHFPNFYVENLQSGTAFGMVVYAQNSKVREEHNKLYTVHIYSIVRRHVNQS